MPILPVFSGVDRPERLEMIKKMQALAMINARIALHNKLLDVYDQYQDILEALDSGAFQGIFDIHEFIDIVLRVGRYFRWISNLDVIGDQQASSKNFEYLQAHLPPELATKIVWVFQPGGSYEELEERAKAYKFIGIGGLVPMLRRQDREGVLLHLYKIDERLHWLDAMAHAFGIGSPRVLRQLSRFPWLYSVDTSKALQAAYSKHEILRRSGTNQCKGQDLDITLTPDMIAESNILTLNYWISGDASLHMPILLTYKVSFTDLSDYDVYDPSFDLTRFEDVFLTWPECYDNDGSVFYTLQGGPSLEKKILAWCQKAKRSHLIDNYEVLIYDAEEHADTVCEMAEHYGYVTRRKPDACPASLLLWSQT